MSSDIRRSGRRHECRQIRVLDRLSGNGINIIVEQEFVGPPTCAGVQLETEIADAGLQFIADSQIMPCVLADATLIGAVNIDQSDSSATAKSRVTNWQKKGLPSGRSGN